MILRSRRRPARRGCRAVSGNFNSASRDFKALGAFFCNFATSRRQAVFIARLMEILLRFHTVKRLKARNRDSATLFLRTGLEKSPIRPRSGQARSGQKIP